MSEQDQMPDFPVEFYCSQYIGEYNSGKWCTNNMWGPAGVKCFTESHVQRLIKEAEERQRRQCWNAVVKSKQHMKFNHVDYALLREAILNATGEPSA